MKRRGPSNVFNIPKWMQNLRVREPEGTRTPDQVASSLELANLLHGPCKDRLESMILAAVPTVPLKRQPYLKALLKGDVVANVQAFIDMVNTQLAALPKEVPDVEPRKEELPARGLPTEPCGGGVGDPVVPTDAWGDDDDWGGSRRPKPSSRGLRALRQAKRGQTDL